jgi:hypothetical protein
MIRDSRPLPEPSWPRVIATTLRLWTRRHILPAQRDSSASRQGYIAALVIVLAAAGVTALAVVRSSQSPAPTPAPAPAPTTHLGPSSAALAADAVTRQHAASWVATQVTRGVIVACDPLMCTALQQQGFPAADLEVIGAGSGDPLGSGIVVSTLAVRSQLGARLGQVYAPLVIASFGSGASLVQIRVTAVGGAAAYLATVQADLQARKFAGLEIASNKNIQVPASGRAELTAGQVDSRLLITLAALAHRFAPVQIRGFGDAGPGAGSTGPLRLMIIAAPTSAYLHQLLAFLHQQRAPLLPLVSERGQGRTTTVQIEFTAPSLIGLLDASAPS